MKYLILVSHGQFAEGVRTSLEMFAGDAVKKTFALCLHNGDSQADFNQQVEAFLQEQQFAADDEFIVLADIIGGSPLTTFLAAFANHNYLENAVVLGGMNFSMALTAAVSLDIMTKEKIVQTALSEGQAAMKQYEPEAQAADEDDI
ncbi:PTS sugar transporter subunit IIA [Lactobacillus sp. ESL0684]|uniref:PTS sugar transporter subunit IIA n=1 Tax=Lactobacillus sp. ESL0684 TaxID=2983213 RepID=UPI0023F8D29E|nr:PTS sugar transporter subunit IIA [Lactobacillus sp. ESL0684]WEV43470.1 PTS sugar transporter subunit IIA [Lactobacillus sp. ESL0684]